VHRGIGWQRLHEEVEISRAVAELLSET
jgi:hypothetical protein